jgi:hypothetical protein
LRVGKFRADYLDQLVEVLAWRSVVELIVQDVGVLDDWLLVRVSRRRAELMLQLLDACVANSLLDLLVQLVNFELHRDHFLTLVQA